MNYRQPVSTVNSFKLKVGSSSGQSAGQTINDMGRKREPDTESRRLIWRPSLAALFWIMSTGNYLNKLLGVLSDYEPMYRWLKLKEKVEELKLKKKKKSKQECCVGLLPLSCHAECVFAVVSFDAWVEQKKTNNCLRSVVRVLGLLRWWLSSGFMLV